MYGEQEDGSSQADTEPYDPDPVDKVTTPKEPPWEGYIIHKVRANDTLTKLSLTYGVSPDMIRF